jgi:hypothetical protein
MYVPITDRVDHSKVGEANSDEADRERAADPLGFYSRYVLKIFDSLSVEDWSQDLRQCATRLAFLRGRIFQSLSMFFRAQHEFRGALKLSKGFPGALMELVKTLLAQGEFTEARDMLIDMIHKELPSFREFPEPDPIDVMKANRHLGMMLVLAESTTKNMRLNHSVGNANQRKIYDVQVNGLLLRRETRHEVEIVHGKPLRYYEKKKEDERREKVRAEIAEADKAVDALRIKARNMARRCQDLVEDTKDALAETVDILKKIPKFSAEERKLLRTRDKERGGQPAQQGDEEARQQPQLTQRSSRKAESSSSPPATGRSRKTTTAGAGTGGGARKSRVLSSSSGLR